jgi:hypothetical protein
MKNSSLRHIEKNLSVKSSAWVKISPHSRKSDGPQRISAILKGCTRYSQEVRYLPEDTRIGKKILASVEMFELRVISTPKKIFILLLDLFKCSKNSGWNMKECGVLHL